MSAGSGRWNTGRRRKRRVAAIAIAALVAGLATSAAAQGGPTLLRGVGIGMTSGAISAALPSDFRLRANLIVRDAPDQVCGYVRFDRRNIAIELILFRCFFGADTVAWADFAQAIDDAYFPGTFAYGEEQGVRLEYPPAANAAVRMLAGPTAAGETIAVVEIIAGYQPTGNGREVFVRVTMTPGEADPVVRPMFN